jgi:hypothetical protein
MKKGRDDKSTRPYITNKAGSGRLDNGARADATGAGVDVHGAAVGGDHANSLQIGQPATTGLVMGVADVVPGSGAFATNLTITGHDDIS